MFLTLFYRLFVPLFDGDVSHGIQELIKWAIPIVFGFVGGAIFFIIIKIAFSVMTSDSDTKWQDFRERVKGLVIGAILMGAASGISTIIIMIINSKTGG